MNLADLRRSYVKGGLNEEEALPDPVDQFTLWFDQVRECGNPEPNAMTLATVGASGLPNARMVLLKEFGSRGFVFYTNHESRKAAEIQANPLVALLFWWPELERQVRIRGEAERLSPEEAEHYFHARPPGHQIGAWASPQSRIIANRAELERRALEMEKRFGSGPVPLPSFWGGYRVRPSEWEFWQGRTNRLHDRLEYVLAPDGRWTIRRLAP